MNVTLRPDLEKFMNEEVKAGRYKSRRQVIEAALGRLMLEPADEFAPGELDALIAEGEEDMARGRISDADAVFERLREFGASFRRKSRGTGKSAMKP